MQNCWITTVTMTLAMKGKRILEANGIEATVSRLPPGLTSSGCAWGIWIDCQSAGRAKAVLEVSNFSYGKMVYADGTPWERNENRENKPPVGTTGKPGAIIASGKGGRR